MPDPAAVKELVDLGGLVLFVFGVAFLAFALFRQWLVFGWQYRDKANSLMKAEAEIKRLSRAVARLTTALARERRRRSSDLGPDA